jgi:hypothetical protein
MLKHVVIAVMGPCHFTGLLDGSWAVGVWGTSVTRGPQQCIDFTSRLGAGNGSVTAQQLLGARCSSEGLASIRTFEFKRVPATAGDWVDGSVHCEYQDTCAVVKCPV